MDRQIEEARKLLRSAANAAHQLESDIQRLVAMRAWDVLGYENFSDMWEKENGFAVPACVQVLAIKAFDSEGLNTLRGPHTNGHTLSDVADAVGMKGAKHAVSRVITQLRHGVPPEHVIRGGQGYDRAIAEHGERPYRPQRKRQQPRRLGKAPNELVNVGFQLTRSQADEIADIARRADVPQAEIYRQAVSEYLVRYNASRSDEGAA